MLLVLRICLLEWQWPRHFPPPAGSPSFHFQKVGGFNGGFPKSLSRCWSSSSPFVFLLVSRNGWQQLTCSSPWTGSTPSGTSSSRTPKCCAPTSTASRISPWAAGKRESERRATSVKADGLKVYTGVSSSIADPAEVLKDSRGLTLNQKVLHAAATKIWKRKTPSVLVVMRTP